MHVKKAGLGSWALFHMIFSKPLASSCLVFSIYNLGKVLLSRGVIHIRATWNAFLVCRLLGPSLDLGKGGTSKACQFHALPKEL